MFGLSSISSARTRWQTLPEGGGLPWVRPCCGSVWTLLGLGTYTEAESLRPCGLMLLASFTLSRIFLTRFSTGAAQVGLILRSAVSAYWHGLLKTVNVLKIIRVFPRKTKATPDDELVRIAEPPGMFDEADEVHVSVSFSWDLPISESLAKAWEHVALVKIGGPATGQRSEAFDPGMYIKKGYIITSRGCPNKCWFCNVWRREGDTVRELKIKDGWNVLDDNLLACSDNHIKKVFSMLSRQKTRPEFTGGFEAKRLKQWHVDELVKIKPKQMFFAYDTPDDYEPLVEAGKMLAIAGFNFKNRINRAYVLCGFPKDSFDDAEKRMRQTIDAGFMPMAMLYRNTKGNRDANWMKWSRLWARPAIIAKLKNTA